MGRRRGSGSESLVQWGLSLLGAMLLANPLTPTLTWRMPWPLHALDTVGQRGSSEYQPAASFWESYAQQQWKKEQEWIVVNVGFWIISWNMRLRWLECQTDSTVPAELAGRRDEVIPQNSINLWAFSWWHFRKNRTQAEKTGHKLFPCIYMMSSSS